MRRVWIAAALAIAARAEFRVIEQEFGGLECASCLESMGPALKRLRGVEAVEVDRAAGRVKLTLAPENRVRLEAVRDALKGMGYTPGAARVQVRGAAVQEGGAWVFRVEGGDRTYRLKGAKRPPAGEVVVVEGTVAAQPDPRAAPELAVAELHP